MTLRDDDMTPRATLRRADPLNGEDIANKQPLSDHPRAGIFATAITVVTITAK